MSSRSSVDELIQCSICLERFTQPKLLPCSHTFCQSCLKGIVKDGKNVDCPICRKSYKVPKGGVNGFPDNLMAIKLLSMVGESTACNDCGEKGILSECEHCQELVCMECHRTHHELVAEISAMIESLEDVVLTSVDETVAEAARSSVKKVCDVDASIQQAVDKAIEALETRREEMLYQVRLLAMIQTSASDREQPKAVAEQIREKLSECLKTPALKATRSCLSCVEGLLAGNDEVEFSYDLCGQVAFGNLTCGGKTINGGDEKSGVIKGKGQFENSCESEGSVAAACSLKEAKPSVVHLPIDIAPLSCNNHIPISAVYSPPENVIYCLDSNGSVLRFDIESDEFDEVCRVFKPAAMTITDTGSMILVDDTQVVRIQSDFLDDIDNCEILKVYQGLMQESKSSEIQALRMNFAAPVQVCSYGDEFVVLDAGEKCIMKFDEYGKFCCEFRSEKFSLSLVETSRMCVDFEGRIYVTNFHIKEVLDSQNYYCDRCKVLPMSATVSWEVVVSILTWDGKYVGQLVAGEGTKNFDYKFNSPFTCPKYDYYKHAIVDEDSLKSFLDQARRENSIGGICVDKDRSISVSMPANNVIKVFDSKLRHYCTIERPKLKEPRGLSLLADGRMLVCDSGNKRLLVI